MRPTPALCSRNKTRIAFTTKQVAGGFYRGNRTGSLGAHTPTGGYLIDWRKVRHFVVPDMQQVKLTPFVHSDNDYKQTKDPRGNEYNQKYSGMDFLKWFRQENVEEFEYEKEYAQRQRAINENSVESQPVSQDDFEFNSSTPTTTGPADDTPSAQQQTTLSGQPHNR